MSTAKTTAPSQGLLPWALVPTLATLACASASLDADSDRLDQRPLILDRTPAEAVTFLGQAFEDRTSWQVRALRPEVGEVQLVHFTGFFRFPDDVLIRIEEHPTGGVVIHAHSKSRYGFYDFGQNARNLQELNKILRTRCAALGVQCRSLGE
ncbi:MAG: DUF1499 domain-containing protein [Thermoanaerobaculia bacterium]